jgi:hypothetical protein
LGEYATGKINIQLATHVKFLNGTTKSCKIVVNVIHLGPEPSTYFGDPGKNGKILGENIVSLKVMKTIKNLQAFNFIQNVVR